MSISTQVAYITLTFIVFVTLFFGFFTIAGAQNNPLGGPLVPKCGVISPDGGKLINCDVCDLLTLGSNILNFLVAFTVIVAVLMFVYAGVLYLTSGPNPSNIQKAHDIFWTVLIGLILVLAAWLIVDVILKTIAKQEYGLGPLSSIKCDTKDKEIDLSSISGSGNISGSNAQSGSSVQYCFTDTNGQNSCHTTLTVCNQVSAQGSGDTCSARTVRANTGGSGSTGGSSGGSTAALPKSSAGSDTRSLAEKRADEERIRKELTANNITVNKGACPLNASYKAVAGGCTDVGKLTRSSVEALITIQQKCDCPVTLTGGSERGHITHSDGGRVDLSLSGSFGTWAEAQRRSGNFTFVRNDSVRNNRLGARYRDGQGNCWLRENDHWHIDVGRCKI